MYIKNMKATTLTKVDSVLNYTNQGVVERIAKEAQVTLEMAHSIFEDTLRFLYLASKTKQALVPTKSIDIGWHAFLMFTRDYQEFCKNHLGQFVHHCPVTSETSTPKVDMAAHTFELARREFGTELSEHWNYVDIHAADCSPDTGGGGNECCPDYD